MKYYTLPINSLIYRGDTSYDPENPFRKKHYFFGTNIKDVEEYGIVYEFETTQPCVLLAIDQIETLRHLYEVANKKMKTILINNYGYIPETHSKPDSIGIRVSVAEHDNQLSEWLCGMGHSGYFIKNMRTEFGGTFHQEIMICDTQIIKFKRRITTDSQIERYQDEKRMLDMGLLLKKQRLTRKRSSRSSHSSHSSHSSPSKTLRFGGTRNTRSTKLRRKRKKFA